MAYFKYRQVADQLLEMIENGTYVSGEKIPKEDELCKQFGVGRQTLRNAVSQLEKAGYLKRIQGSGTYVCDRGSGAEGAGDEPEGLGSGSSFGDINSVRPGTGAVGSRTQSGTVSLTGRAAGSTPAGNPGSVALIMMNSQDYIFLNVMRGVSDVLTEKGYVLNTIVTDGSYEKERLALENLLRNPPAGILLEPVCSGLLSINEPLYRKVAARIPCLLLHTNSTDVLPAIQLDDREGMRRATEYLLSIGHRKIGTIFGFDEMTGQNRYLGYMEALRAQGLSPEPGMNVWTQYNQKELLFEASGCLVLEQMLHQVTAVLCHDDRLALRLITYLSGKGIRVPEDLSVIGYDDSDFSVSGLPLTTVAHPKVAYGNRAAEALLEMIRMPGQANPAAYQIEPELVIRESTTPRGAISRE